MDTGMSPADLVNGTHRRPRVNQCHHHRHVTVACGGMQSRFPVTRLLGDLRV